MPGFIALLLLFADPPARLSGPPADLEVSLVRGERLAQERCGGCHAIGAVGDSPMVVAPPFRDIPGRYPVEHLEEALAEGIIVAHDAVMPTFELEPDEINDILAHMRTLHPERHEGIRVKHPARAFRPTARLPESLSRVSASTWAGVRTGQSMTGARRLSRHHRTCRHSDHFLAEAPQSRVVGRPEQGFGPSVSLTLTSLHFGSPNVRFAARSQLLLLARSRRLSTRTAQVIQSPRRRAAVEDGENYSTAVSWAAQVCCWSL